MNSIGPIFVELPSLLAVGAVLGLAIIAIAMWRRARLPRAARALAGLGVLLLIVAAGGARWHVGPPLRVAVVVDGSASTRGAAFRDAAFMRQRLDQLMGGVAYNRVDMGSEQAERTEFVAPAADAVVLFSDGRFDAPLVAPPMFVVVDPTLSEAPDAAVAYVDIRDDEIIIRIRNSGPGRTLTVAQGDEAISRDVPPGLYSIALPRVVGVSRVVATLSAGDSWPENDSLTVDAPPPATRELWWVGDDPPGGAWQSMTPEQLPTEAGTYLEAAAIVLDNVAANRLSSQQLDRVSQFARELGGGLVIGGGESAFAAGGYIGTALDTLSPLASAPPEPQRRWILLVDASGSMASTFDKSKRWNFAADALAQALRSLPPNDAINIGSFARELRWWTTGQSVREATEMPLPPADVSPSGPTNLQAAIEQVIASTNDASPTELLVLTDAEANISDPVALAEALKRQQIRVHVLATSAIDDSNAVATLARSTGGQVVSQVDPRNWSDAITRMSQAALPDRVSTNRVVALFTGNLAALGELTIDTWHRTWLKSDATPLASATHDDETIPLAAAWNVGAGRVAAAAFDADADTLAAMANLVSAPARDPRFAVSWDHRAVKIDAIDQGKYLNGLAMSLRVNGQLRTIPQSAPGRYELQFDAPRAPSLAEVLHDGRIVDRRSLAGRYAREFDAIGNDVSAMRELTYRTGGAVVLPDQRAPIDFPPARHGILLTPYLAAAGGALVGLGLLLWRRMV